MADFVIRNDLLLVVGQHRGLALLSGDDDLNRLLKIVLRGTLATLTDGSQGALVDDVGQVGARGTGRGAGNRGQVDRRLCLHALGMQLKNVLTAGQVGQLDGDAAIKTTGAQQSGIEAVGTVGGSEDDDTLVVIETVHLGQQLVERLLALIVAAKAAAIALLADGINLIDKDDTRGLFLGLLKQVANFSGTAADEHLNKLRTRNTKERHARLAGHSLGKQGFTSTRRADKQSTTRQLGADLLVALRLLQKVNDLLEGLLGLFLAGDILKGHAHVLGGDHARAGLTQSAAAKTAAAKVHRRAVIAHSLLHATVEPPTDEEENRHGKDEREQIVGHQTRVFIGNDRLQRSARLKHAIGKARIIRHTGRLIGDVLVLALLGVINRIVVGVVLDLFDALLVERFDKRRVIGLRNLLRVTDVGEQNGREHEVDDEGDEHVEDHIPSTLVVIHLHLLELHLLGLIMLSRIPNPDGDKPTPGTKRQRWHHWKSARFKSIRATARARRRLLWGARGCRGTDCDKARHHGARAHRPRPAAPRGPRRPGHRNASHKTLLRRRPLSPPRHRILIDAKGTEENGSLRLIASQ